MGGDVVPDAATRMWHERGSSEQLLANVIRTVFYGLIFPQRDSGFPGRIVD